MPKQEKTRHILHLDMDAFYPAVEVCDHPELKGKPVIVGGSRERGVVSSASYEARKFGVHSAQPMATALRLCPGGVFLPGRMWRYKEISDQIFEIFRRFTPLVEPLSIDEAFLDVTGSERLFGRPEVTARTIKETVLREIGLTVSAGVAPSKFVAKIASDIEKPDGLTVVPADRVRKFLDPLPISRMWGVGKVTQKAFTRLNIHTFRDLRRMPVQLLEQRFGKQGLKMHLLAMGVDDREVIPFHEVKSIGHEETFSEDIRDLDPAKKETLALANRVARRMRRKGLTGRTVTLKVKYSDFKQITRSNSLVRGTDDGHEIYVEACRLLKKTAVGKRPVRLLGISVSHFSSGPHEQLSLFERNEEERSQKELHEALDTIQDRFGAKGISPGTLIEKPPRKRTPYNDGESD